MQRRYATADVFTAEPMTGNPVAVVLDAEGLTAAQMQALAAEFGYVETTFVLPPADPAHTARVRIFTPDREIPFAGHPTLGTAFLLARERAAAGAPPLERFVFEEGAGLVTVDLMHGGGAVLGADLLSPQPLTRSAEVDVGAAAACLGLGPDDVRTDAHRPQVASVGLPFLMVELASREALRRVRPDRAAYDALLPLDGARSVYAYARAAAGSGLDFHARMFTWRLVEDPATGSATAALTALLAKLRVAEMPLRVRQGEDMGRPSTLETRAVQDGAQVRARVGGRCAAMFAGTFDLD